MDSEEVFTPRSGRKKKSTLSKLAAKGRRRASEDTEISSLPNGGLSHQQEPKYPIDANVEIRPNTHTQNEDSDEGIGVADESLSYIDRRFSGSLGAANDPVQSSDRHPSGKLDYTERTDANHNTNKTDTQCDNAGRPQSAGVLESDPPRSPFKSKPDQLRSEMSDPEDTVDHTMKEPSSPELGAKVSVMKVREALESESLSYMDAPKPSLTSTKEQLKEQLTNVTSSPFRSNLTGKHISRSDEDLLTRYRESLAQTGDTEKDINHEERDEMADDVSALRQGVNRSVVPNALRSSATQSLFGSHDRTWGSLNKFGAGGFDTLSQRSFQSTSVLPLITTKEARNRSFLVGSMSGRTALMGLEEMERFFPDHKMRIFCGTWNMCDMKLLPESLDDWLLPDTSDYIQDMYVIGTQESCPNRKEWEVRLQETLGPSHVLFHTAVHGVLYLVVFLRRDLIWFCSVSEEATVTTRLGPTNIATKGAVALCFTFFGTSFLLINSHLAPHDGKVKERIADYNKITSNLNLPTVVTTNPYGSSHDDTTTRFDSVFWMGDLNFRLEKERERVDSAMNAVNSQEIPSYDDLTRHDELFRVRNEGLAFQDFQEGRIKFKPTYKFDKGTDNYDTSKKLRIPSYTDRILFRSRKKNSISCLYYDSVNALKDSDHKPVYAMYEVLIRPGKDNIPLAAGQFNREVWLEGNRRRAERLANQKQRSKASSVCSIQ